MEKRYGTSADIWSLGCVLAELIFCTRKYKNKGQKMVGPRRLFRGSSCFPLSPSSGISNFTNQDENIVSNNDQLIKILEVLGHQDSSDLSFVTEESALNYHKSLVKPK